MNFKTDRNITNNYTDNNNKKQKFSKIKINRLILFYLKNIYPEKISKIFFRA